MALGFFKSDPQTALMDPDVIAAKRKLLLAADAERRKIKPIQHWTQGAAMLANALADKQQEDKLNEADKAGNAALAAALSGAFGATPAAASSPVAASVPGGAASSTPGATPAANPAVGEVFKRMLTQESGNRQFDKSGKPITSSAGALGIAQIMPGTAPEAAKLAGLPYDPARLRNDANYNKALGQAYYNAQVQKFQDPYAAAAAYNAGPGRVQSAIKRQEATGRPFTDFLPAETTNYMSRVGAGGASNAPQAIAQATAANPAATPAAAPVAAPAATGGANPSVAALMSNPALMKRLQKNPLAMALLLKQVQKNPAKDALTMQILKNKAATSSPEFMQRMAKMRGSQTGQFGVTPVYGQTPDGKLAIGQLNKQGGIKWVDAGGNTISQPVKTVDLGTSVRTIGTKTGAAVGPDMKKDIAGAASAKVVGAAQGKDIAAREKDYTRATDTIKSIDALIADPGLSNITGPVMSRLPNITGQATRAQSRLDQLRGKAFMEAYAMLRGGGQITEVEGQKAENAIARMNQAQSTEDFKAALIEFRDAVKAGRDKLYGGKTPPKEVTSGTTGTTGKVRVYNPATGKIE